MCVRGERSLPGRALPRETDYSLESHLEKSSKFAVWYYFALISQKVSIKSFCKSPVNISFVIPDMKKKLTDLCGNRLLQNEFTNTFCEIS